MMKHKAQRDSDTVHLNNKMFAIHVLNFCTLSCGGCDQFCGYFNKKKNWVISLDELNKAIEVFKDYRKNWKYKSFPASNKIVLIYGGEPTLHPQFDAILDCLYSNPDIPFVIYTNGRTFVRELKDVDLEVSQKNISRQVYHHPNLPKTGYAKYREIFRFYHTHEKNVAYRIDLKNSQVRDMFIPTLCAPCDLQQANQGWSAAKKRCYKWQQCENAIYKGRAYVCNVAAAMDLMFYEGKYGWAVGNSNPFEKTAKQIAEQMQHFCHRCGYNFQGNLEGFDEITEKTQYIHKGSLITKTNYRDIDKHAPFTHKLELIDLAIKKTPPELFR